MYKCTDSVSFYRSAVRPCLALKTSALETRPSVVGHKRNTSIICRSKCLCLATQILWLAGRPASAQRQTAVYTQLGTGDEGGHVGCQEQRRGSHLLRLCNPLQQVLLWAKRRD